MSIVEMANRIERTLTLAAKQSFPFDLISEFFMDVDSIKARCSELKRTMSFEDAVSTARTEFIVRVLEENADGVRRSQTMKSRTKIERLCLICGKLTQTTINNGPYHTRCVKHSLLGGDGPPDDRSRGCERNS